MTLQESGWAPGPVWTVAESVAPHWRKVCGLSDESTKQIERTADICLVIHFFLGIPSRFPRLRRQTVVDGNWQACWQCALHVLQVQTPGALHSRTPLVQQTDVSCLSRTDCLSMCCTLQFMTCPNVTMWWNRPRRAGNATLSLSLVFSLSLVALAAEGPLTASDQTRGMPATSRTGRPAKYDPLRGTDNTELLWEGLIVLNVLLQHTTRGHKQQIRL